MDIVTQLTKISENFKTEASAGYSAMRLKNHQFLRDYHKKELDKHVKQMQATKVKSPIEHKEHRNMAEYHRNMHDSQCKECEKFA